MRTADIPSAVWRAAGVDVLDVAGVASKTFDNGTGAASGRVGAHQRRATWGRAPGPDPQVVPTTARRPARAELSSAGSLGTLAARARRLPVRDSARRSRTPGASLARRARTTPCTSSTSARTGQRWRKPRSSSAVGTTATTAGIAAVARARSTRATPGRQRPGLVGGGHRTRAWPPSGTSRQALMASSGHPSSQHHPRRLQHRQPSRRRRRRGRQSTGPRSVSRRSASTWPTWPSPALNADLLPIYLEGLQSRYDPDDVRLGYSHSRQPRRSEPGSLDGDEIAIPLPAGYADFVEAHRP